MRAECRRAQEIDPAFPITYDALGIAYAAEARHSEPIAALDEAVARSRCSPEILGALGCAHADAGDARAIAIVEELAAGGAATAYHRATVLTAFSRHADALACLDHAVDTRSEWCVWLEIEPRLDRLRDDPRFRALVTRAGLARADPRPVAPTIPLP